MRDFRARYHRRATAERSKAAVEACLAKLRGLGLLRDGDKTVAILKKETFQIVPAHSHCQNAGIPYRVMCAIAYFRFKQCSDASRAFNVTEDTIIRARALLANAGMTGDRLVMNRLANEYSLEIPEVFCGAGAADCTTEELNLPFAGFTTYADLPHVTRSSWHVCVSGSRFSWVPKRSGGRLKWYVMEVIRPCLPLTTTEIAKHMYETLYDLPQIQPHTELETAGLRYGKKRHCILMSMGIHAT